jgi:1-deoxy-D-xylulose-5-phosphate reductoisomerase
MKKISVLGSTGSIGCSALNVVAHLPDELEIVALAARRNIDLLEKQAKQFKPKLVAVFEEDKAKELSARLPGIRVVAGMEGLLEAATLSDADFVVSALVGTIGLRPTIATIEAGITVGLANKEALVSGGALVMDLAKQNGVPIIPIDSEHSAIFQCLQSGKAGEVHRIILTSSGGPFREFSEEQLASVTVKQALNHPTWTMGPKVTIDSSTLMNKGLEVIEAHWLFGMSPEEIDVVIHPQSIIHSLVEFRDNSSIAQIGAPEMVTPIQYALTYPDRHVGTLPPFNLAAQGTLNFSTPDKKKFRCLGLAYEAIARGGTLPCYMNAANEALVERFLAGEIRWQEIAQRLEALMERHSVSSELSLDSILACDAEARQEAALA